MDSPLKEEAQKLEEDLLKALRFNEYVAALAPVVEQTNFQALEILRRQIQTTKPTGATATGGEIYELYLRPECQGVGLGSRLFHEARRRLAEAGLRSVTIWCLTENRAGCRFYRRLCGTVTASARGGFGGVLVEKTAFSWA